MSLYSIHILKNKLVTIFSIVIILSSIFFPVASDSSITLPPIQKGMSYVTWDKNRFSSQYSDQSLRKLKSMGVDCISICVTRYQEKHNSTIIMKTDRTPSDASLSHAIVTAQRLGFRIMLKPHIDLISKFDDTHWRADIGFHNDEDWQAWFKEYNDFILHYAKMAEKLKVDIFCVGTELTFTTTQESQWRRTIANIKKIYSGKTVYAANWDNYKKIKFWNEVDFVGIDAYFPLTYEPNPSIEALKNGWKKWNQEIETWQAKIKKPIIFTEIGYASTPHAAYTPWKGGANGAADLEIQTNCYKAFFETVWGKPWLVGAYWWKWDTNTRSGGNSNKQFTPQNKPAQKIIEAHYKEQKIPNRGKWPYPDVICKL